MGGAQHQGIDYTALYGHPKYARLSFDEQDELLAQIQHIEAGALAALNDNPLDDSEERRQMTASIASQHQLQIDSLLQHYETNTTP